MTILLAACSGLLWGALAHGLEVAHALPIALVAGLTVGLLMGFLVKPLRDVDWPAAAALSLLGLYVAVVLFAAAYSVGDLVTSRQSLANWPAAIAEACWDFAWGLSLSGYVFLLWPLSFANHTMVWWCQRRNNVIPAK